VVGGAVSAPRQHYGLVAAADITNGTVFVELLRLTLIGMFYDNFAMFRDEAKRRDP
jgi:hypothetical protein